MNLAETIKQMGQPLEEKADTAFAMEELNISESPEDDMPPSPDEKSMALRQAEFIAYVADEIEEYIEGDNPFPEWMQNKLTALHESAEGVHSAMAGRYKDDEDELDEARNPSKSGGTGYDLYHKDFSSAMQHAYKYAKDKLGVEIDPQEIDNKVASGPRRPSKGKTNTYRLMGKDGKKGVQIQVANLDDKKFELNMYKESFEMELEESKFEFEGNASNKNLQNLARRLGVKLTQKGKMVVATGGRSAIDKMEIELDLEESFELDEAQRLFMFKTKAEADKKAKEVNGKVVPLTKQNFAVVVEEIEMDMNEEEKRYQVDIEGGGRETVMARTGKEAIDKVTRKMGIRAHGKRNKMTVKVVEEVDMNEAFESLFDTDRHGNTKSFLDAIMNVVSEKKELDPVNKKALKKDFDDRKDKDIDNDGDVDDSDEYLHKRRQAISKAVSSDKAEAENDKEVSDKEDEPKGKVGKSGKQTKVDVNPSIEEEKGEPMTSAEMKKREEIVKSMKDKERKRLRAVDKAIATSRKPISGKEAKLIHALLKGRMKTESVEAEMSDAEMEKRDEIMKSLEKRKSEFEKKYGDRAKEVMARTAIKMAKKNA